MRLARSMLVLAVVLLAPGCTPRAPRPARPDAPAAPQPMPEWLEHVPPMPQSP